MIHDKLKWLIDPNLYAGPFSIERLDPDHGQKFYKIGPPMARKDLRYQFQSGTNKQMNEFGSKSWWIGKEPTKYFDSERFEKI